jgi:hypothetical protein
MHGSGDARGGKEGAGKGACGLAGSYREDVRWLGSLRPLLGFRFGAASSPIRLLWGFIAGEIWRNHYALLTET